MFLKSIFSLLKGAMMMVKVKPCLEKLVRYFFTPIFLLEIIPIASGIYVGAKVGQRKGYMSSDVEIRYKGILKKVYEGRKDLYFPKEPLF